MNVREHSEYILIILSISEYCTQNQKGGKHSRPQRGDNGKIAARLNTEKWDPPKLISWVCDADVGSI